MIANANGLVKVLERKGGILSAQPARFTPLRQAAESLSRANIHRAHCEILNEAITRCTVMLYERDNTGRWVNIDRSGQALIALPWGRAGQREWGLRRSEADALRALLFAWQRRHEHGHRAVHDAAIAFNRLFDVGVIGQMPLFKKSPGRAKFPQGSCRMADKNRPCGLHAVQKDIAAFLLE